MSNNRFYQPGALTTGSEVALSDDVFGHVIRVLRLKTDDIIYLFNGDGHDYQAKLTQVSKKQAFASIENSVAVDNESPLRIHLGQGISRGDRMDFTLQKSVELGVNQITPLFTERCGVKLSGERLEKKRQQWQKIVISACEQSGRAQVPEVMPAQPLSQWLSENTDELKLNLHPKAQYSISTLPMQADAVRLLIGPEGGLSDDEISDAGHAGFTDVLLGPRVLRTETAALTAITALQCKFGDL
ncbi:16S rRNA (uracil(1498)-N(3))-methyltransferase [Thalassotalea sp. HSM 43]|uniref:16S rRNA (uracil(1498)-N(3))-methyltransferase n=1 Tax=Thalassotalea sp. HSM 43 TaxID=2552945 RepID=UPI0010800AF4|nr:16S rRNA (uracil(1498)-N(3))-methyltransferase [Thalassotalea sp. HSM 43]QBY05063.1 16S rRNA (uracil(1498)-N(3))-methyltransferase [Thalassotalea sp. HSM 43]